VGLALDNVEVNMKTDQIKILFLLIGVWAFFSFFIGIGNEKDLQEIQEQLDKALVVQDSLVYRMELLEDKVALWGATYK